MDFVEDYNADGRRQQLLGDGGTGESPSPSELDEIPKGPVEVSIAEGHLDSPLPPPVKPTLSSESIFNDACNGKLNENALAECVDFPRMINLRWTKEQFTPLMAAVMNGHRKSVKLLVQLGANTTKRSAQGETALSLAVAKSPKKNRRKIVKYLLQAKVKPNLDAGPSYGSLNTPLMLAIVETEDEYVVSLLVDAGAKLDLRNKNGFTAKDLAEQKSGRTRERLLKALRPVEEREEFEESRVVKMIRNLISHVVGSANALGGAAVGYFKSTFGLSGAQDISLPEDLQILNPNPSHSRNELEESATYEEFKENVVEYIHDSGLNKFFSPENPVLEKLAAGLTAFRSSEHALNTPDKLKGLTKLSLYQTIVFCDDSSSMENPTILGGVTKRADAQKRIVQRITSICSTLLPVEGGIHVRYFNKDVKWDKLKPHEVVQCMGDMTPCGGSRIGKKLHKHVLEPFVYRQLDKGLDTPFLICIITDGSVTEKDGVLTSVITDCLKTLKSRKYGDGVVSFVIAQIGDNPHAERFLDKLRDCQQFGKSVYICKDRIDTKYRAPNQNCDDLDRHLFEIISTPIMASG